MKKLIQVLSKSLIVLIFLCALSCEYNDYPIDNDYYIAEFPGNKKAAISYTFDDNCQSSFSIIAPLLKEYGYSATFFIIAGRIKNDADWQQWRDLNDVGFEIGNHSLNHLELAKIPDRSSLTNEINQSYDLIRAKIGQAPFSFAHPYNSTNDSVDAIVFQRHFASRISPKGFCNDWGIVSESTQDMVDFNWKEMVKRHEWLVIAGHGVNDGYKPITKDLLLHMLIKTKGKEGDLFIGNFGTMSKYKMEIFPGFNRI